MKYQNLSKLIAEVQEELPRMGYFSVEYTPVAAVDVQSVPFGAKRYTVNVVRVQTGVFR